jgi:hypothetical protein
MRKFLLISVGVLVGVFLLLQVIPYGRDHSNPPIISEPIWPDTNTQSLAERACYDCHSNQTEWPWYSNVAPVSWLVQHDVQEGRHTLNFSDWANVQGDGAEAEELSDVVLDGEMPPANFLITHPEARLTMTEKQQLAQGLAVLGGSREEHEESHDDKDD